MKPACPKCGGLLFYDNDYASDEEVGMAPALVCWRGCTRVDLDVVTGDLLVVEQPTRRSHPLEQQILVAHSQGVSRSRIALELRVDWRLVDAVVSGN